jgi:hypothetical protein
LILSEINPKLRLLALARFAALCIAANVSATRNQAQAPQTRQADDGVNEATQPCRVAFKEVSHKIKLKETPKPPVESSNDDKEKGQYI